MAGLMVAGAALGALFNVVFDRLDSPLVVDFFRRKNKNLGPLLDRMKTTLTVLNDVLNDAETKQFEDPNVKDWLNELKNVVYMADDLLDEVSTKAATATPKEVTTNFIFRFFNAQDRRKMASRLKEIVDKLEHILKLKESLDLKEIAMDNSSSRVPSTSVQDRNIYGRDVDKEAIIKLLLDDNDEAEQVSVIPIVGMGGVGKTTLAQMVYNDDNLKQISNFDFTAWVCVSEAFDIMRVTKTLSEALTQQASEINDLNSLQENLVEKLRGKKFLIILDDVWIEDYVSWKLLIKPFQYGMRGSVILVTTRSVMVASRIQTVQTYHLSLLSNEDCWSVFAKHACLSPGSGENTTALEKVGLEIVKKCKGLPLAAQSLGGLLRRKHDIKDWNNVLNCDIWELPESESKIIPSLRISYHYLPPHLKRCFVYCSLFPKDFEFEKNDVIMLWMAEDLLPPPKNGKSLEDVGDECFNYLVSTSFLQCSSDPCNEECFGMHDLMHDLATFLGGESYFRTNAIGKETKIGSKTCHFSFTNYSSPNSENIGVFSGSNFLRTLLGTNYGYSPSRKDEEIPCIELSNMEFLRVLSFHSFRNFCALPDSIGGLIHLRYLDLSRTEIKSLPESLCNLYNLQTLKLEHCDRLTMLPSGMQNLVNLHYLGIDGTSMEEMPKGMSKLKQLQHLPYFIVGKHKEVKIKELGGLSNLGGSFTIYPLENVENGSEASEARMMDKKHIQHLELSWSWSSNEGFMDSQAEMDILCKLEPHQDLKSLKIKGYRGTRYPDWVGKPCFHRMTRIRLSCFKNCFTVPSLGHLLSLKHLSIYNLKMLKTVDASFFENDDDSLLTVPFPSLESLEFEMMPCWESWSCFEQPHAFPQLKCLKIAHCPKLKGDLPIHLPALEQLEIRNCEQLACSLPRAPAIESLTIQASATVTESVFEAIFTEQLTRLRSLTLWDCSSAKSFPRDCLPASLNTLHIQNSRELEFPVQQQTHKLLELLEIKSSCDSLKSLPLESFPNLKRLYISDCENLEALSVSQSWEDVAIQNLTDLVVNKCPNLVSLAREGLPAPSMIRFMVSDCDKLESLPCPMNTLLPNLKSFELRNCPRIEWLPEEDMPPSLTEITLGNCKNLLRGGLEWPSMDMLTSITIYGPCDGIKSIPKEDFLPPSLKWLWLYELSSLETLDCKGLLHLTSLQELTIGKCPKLVNMAGERLPASLTTLVINACPLLREQCRAKHPQIWPKISHIQHIEVDRKVIS